MIGRGEITKQAQIDRVDAQTVERDYILAHVASRSRQVLVSKWFSRAAQVSGSSTMKTTGIQPISITP